MLSKRLLSGLLFLPFFYLFTWKLPPVYFTALVTVAVVIGQFEFYRMAKAGGTSPNIVLGMLIGVFVIYQAYRPVIPLVGYYPVGLFLLLIMTARLFSPRPVEGAVADISATALGVLYVAVLFSFQVALLRAFGKQWLVFVFFIIWATDIGAYAVGVPFGRHRLYEKISPKKSVEGLIGSFAAAAGMSLVCRAFLPAIGAGEIIGIALLLAAVGTIGDLAESLLKRAVGVKDSGGIIPGHGGILDRMDSMLFAAPVLYYYLKIR